jgi:hypothetical protein
MNLSLEEITTVLSSRDNNRDLFVRLKKHPTSERIATATRKMIKSWKSQVQYVVKDSSTSDTI